MINKKYEKEKAKELLKLIEEYMKTQNKSEKNHEIHKLSDELYNKNRTILSQPMIDVSLALYSFTEAAMSGGPLQPLDEFIPDLNEIIKN
ncbi:MAG: hypothetical protein AABW83_00535 [Nanoarchaeota archaeon]